MTLYKNSIDNDNNIFSALEPLTTNAPSQSQTAETANEVDCVARCVTVGPPQNQTVETAETANEVVCVA